VQFALNEDEAMLSETARTPTAANQSGATASDWIASLFQPDTLLAEQFLANQGGNTLPEPEKRLLLAVLADAIYCFQDYCLAQDENRRRLFEDARRWIFETGGDWVFSFDNVCNALGFNPEYIRKGMRRWWEKKLSSRRNDVSLK
jgi:hypothetical protein